MYKSVGVGVLSRIIGIGSNIIIMPLLLHNLSDTNFTLWMLFTSFYSLVIIFDFGFSATTSRYISYGYNGLSLDNFMINKFNITDEKYNAKFISLIVYANKKIFILLTIICVFIVSIIYIYYMYIVKMDLNISQKISFVLYLCSIVIILVSIKSNGILHGSGNVSSVYINNILSNVLFLILSVFSIYYNFGLLGICICRLISSMCLLILNNYMEKKILSSISLESVYLDDYINKIIKKVKHNALKLGVGSLGGYLSNRTTVIVLTSVFSLEKLSGVSFLVNISIIIVSTVLILLNNVLPKFVELRANNRIKELKSTLIKMFLVMIALFFSLYWIMVLILPYFLDFINSEVIIPETHILILCFVMFMIEIIVSISTAFISTGNNVTFSKYQLIFGLLFILLCFLFNYFGELSIELVFIIQIVTQLLYNFWRWPLFCFSELKMLTVKLDN
ncbi:TPA: hypothetical protein ACX6QO_003354 [Photobacterium damselae]